MNDLMIFENPEFGKIRTLTIDGEPWVVGKDVATILGYSNPRDALSKHVDADDKGASQIATPSGMQEMTIINESGLYSLILSSKLPGAKRFKHWVTSEVLPTIRRTGAYMMPQMLDVLGSKIQVYEWAGQRVLTFQNVDVAHQLPRGTASRNFRENHTLFAEGVDYFKASGDEFRRAGINGMTLLTESGYLILAEFLHNAFTSDVKKILEAQYFMNPVEETPPPAPAETEYTVSVADHSTLIQCASIMASCMEINRPNVLNILRHIVPDIDRPEQKPQAEPVTITTEEAVVNIPAVPEQSTVIVAKKTRYFNCKLCQIMEERNLKGRILAERIGCSRDAVRCWKVGKCPPSNLNREKLCSALGVAVTYFDS